MDIQSIASSLTTQINPAGSGAVRAAPIASESVAKTKTSEVVKSTQQTEPVNRQQLDAALKNVRAFVEPINSDLEFSMDEDTGQTIVKIIDRNTKEIIRQMPSEEMVAIAKALDSIKGLFVKQKA